jgi:DNA repair protein RadD
VINLFPDQIEFENGIRAAMADSDSVLGVAPTGFGKTIVFSDISAKAEAKGNSVGIFAHRVEILEQIGDALGRFGVNYGYLAPGYAPNPLASVQVCSTQAMAKRVDRLMRRPFDLCIVDEAHHAAEGTAAHAIVSAHTRNKKKVLGVTATPQRLSGQPLSIAFGTMVVGPSTADLIQMGRLSPYRLFSPSRPDMAQVKRVGGDFNKADITDIMDRPSITGDAVEHWFRFARGKRTIVFCASVAHAEHVAEKFRARGIRSAALDGKLDRHVRRQMRNDFSAGQIEVLTSCDIVSEGYDLPAIEVAILLRPTESLALYLQQVGRALRIYPGKSHAVILDHAGNSLAKEQGGRGHGFPDDPRKWVLGEAIGGRKGGQTTSPTIICGECFGTYRPGPARCPYCGCERDIQGRYVKFIEGTLEEVDPNLVRQAREEEKRQKHIAEKIEERACVTLADWRALGKKRGHAPGWGDIQFKVHKKKPKVPA